MQKIPNQIKHPNGFLLIITSKVFERIVYYGFRSILILSLINDPFKLGDEKAIYIYSFFTALIFISHPICGLLGDFVFGNKRAIIIGNIIQIVGFGLMFFPLNSLLYVGLVLFILGAGLFNSNLVAEFGKLYNGKKQIIDAGFSSLFSSINIAAFFGTLLISMIFENYGFNITLICLITISTCSLLLYLKHLQNDKELINSDLIDEQIVSEQKINTNIPTENTFRKQNIKLIFNIILMMIGIGIYWKVFELPSVYHNINTGNNSKNYILILLQKYNISSALGILFGFSISIIWSYYYQKRKSKLLISVVCLTLALICCLFIDNNSNASFNVIFFIILLQAISELFISPLLYAYLTTKIQHKYLATIMGFSYLSVYLFNISFIEIFNNIKPSSNLYSIIISSLLIFIIYLIYFHFYKNRKIIESENN